MNKKKEIFEALTKEQLVDIARHLGHRSWQVITKGEIVKRLARQKKYPMRRYSTTLKYMS